MLAENDVSVVVKVRLVSFAPVLLSVFACGSSFDNLSAVDTSFRTAHFGETGSFKIPFT